jgi:hypothetical protein
VYFADSLASIGTPSIHSRPAWSRPKRELPLGRFGRLVLYELDKSGPPFRTAGGGTPNPASTGESAWR